MKKKVFMVKKEILGNYKKFFEDPKISSAEFFVCYVPAASSAAPMAASLIASCLAPAVAVVAPAAVGA